MKKKLTALLVFIIFAVNTFANDVLEISNPSKANTNDKNNYLIKHETFYISYNSDLLIPNWVGWHLDSSDLGTGRHTGTFVIDSLLPSDWTKATHSDYNNTGYDRGHLCPNADRNAYDNGKETFITTNIIPQTPECNRKIWKSLEDYCRCLVENKPNELYIYSGIYGESGKMSDKKISIPEYCWKIIILLPEGENDLSRITKDTVCIAVLIPNTDKYNKDISTYSVSIRYIEELTGYDFLENVPKDTQDSIENVIFKHFNELN